MSSFFWERGLFISESWAVDHSSSMEHISSILFSVHICPIASSPWSDGKFQPFGAVSVMSSNSINGAGTLNANMNIIDMNGRVISNLFDGYRTKGKYQVNINNALKSNIISKGMYLLQFDFNGKRQIEKLVIAH
jgi:hypothetical protein